MKEYIDELNNAKAKNLPDPKIPDYIGECFMLIAKNLANKPNFSGYSFKEEMISDGVINCVLYMHNFNPDKFTNPFAYFTQMIKFAFLRALAFSIHFLAM